MGAYYGLGLGLGGAPVPIRGSHLAIGGLVEQFPGAAAAYSLRGLRNNVGSVVRVRRSSDNAEQDFTASEMGAALEDWVNTDYEVYSSDFSAGIDGWTSPSSFVGMAREDAVGGLDDVLNLDCSGNSGRFKMVNRSNLGLSAGEKHSVTFRYYTTDSSFSGKYWNVGEAFSTANVVTSSTNDQIISDGTWREVTLAFNNEDFGLRLKVTDTSGGAYGSLLDGLSGSIYIRDVVLTTTHANGFVETWYDQSGNGNDATQTVAANQPKIVDAGTYLGEIDFDGTDDFIKMDSEVTLGTEFYVPMVVTAVSADSESNATFIGSDNSGGGNRLYLSTTANKLAYRNNATNYTTSLTPSGTEAELVSYTATSSNMTTSLNGTDDVDAALAGSMGAEFIGGGTGFNLAASFKEIIIYNSDQSSNRTAIEANINNHYSIY